MIEQVIKGAAVLDEKVPGWRDKIDPDTLDLESLEDCVLGQLFPLEESERMDYGTAWGKGMKTLFPNYLDTNEHIEYGFECDSGNGQTYEELTAAWKEYLAPVPV